jgi:SWIM zinc finger
MRHYCFIVVKTNISEEIKMIAVTNLKSINEKREKRAMSISSMGLVNRVGGRFQVSTPSLRGKQNNYEVWRDDSGKIRCSCLEFEENTVNDSKFRCEHILAVKFALATQNSESVTKQTKTETGSNESKIGEQTSEKLQTTTNIKGKDTMKRYNEIPLIQSKKVESTEKSNNVVPMNFAGTLRNLSPEGDSKQLKHIGNVQAAEYLECAVADLLDQKSPNWSHTVKDIRQIGSFVTVIAAVTIDGVTREGLGTGLANSETGIKRAEYDALKSAAGKFRIVGKLNKNELELVERGGTVSSQKPVIFPENPFAKSLSDLITAKQLGMLRSISRESGIDVNKECKTILCCSTDELSKSAASSLIEHLQALQKHHEKNVFPMRIAS